MVLLKKKPKANIRTSKDLLFNYINNFCKIKLLKKCNIIGIVFCAKNLKFFYVQANVDTYLACNSKKMLYKTKRVVIENEWKHSN